MAREDVNIKVSANVAEAIQMWKAMEAGPEGMAKQLSALGQKGKAAGKDMGAEILSTVGKWATVGTAIAAVTSAINAQREALRQLREEKVGITNSVDDVWNRIQVQSGIPNGANADRTRTQLMSIITNRKVAPIAGLTAAEQLGSAGASMQDIVGGGLDEFLQMITASNAAGKNVDSGQLAGALVNFLNANGKSPNREGMRGTSLAIQQLFGGTNLQASNLARFAADAGTIAKNSHMPAEDQLAAYSMFLDTMNEDTGSTAFRSGIVSLSTAGATMEKVRALKMLGLKPEDVDFQGEDHNAVFGTLNKAFGKLPGDKQNIAAKLLFGQEGLPFFNVMIQDGALSELQKRGAMARSTSGAAERLGIAEGGRGAAARQAEALAAMGMYQQDIKDPKVMGQRLDALLGFMGADENTAASIRGEFKDGPEWWPNWAADMSPEGRARAAAKRLASGDPRFRFKAGGRESQLDGLAAGERSGAAIEQRYYDQIIGKAPIKVQIIGPDGTDIPHEPAAAGLSQ